MSPTSPAVMALVAIVLIVIGRKFKFTWLVVAGFLIIVGILVAYSPDLLDSLVNLFGQGLSAAWELIKSIDMPEF